MTELPHGLADPLHIEEPFPAWAVILALLALWLLYRLYRKLRSRPPRAAPTPPPPPPPTGFPAIVSEIRRRYREDCRRGCHELAAALRRYFEALGHADFESLTVAEMEDRLGDRPVARLFALLAELQFFRRAPSRSDFEGACDLAVDVAARTGSR